MAKYAHFDAEGNFLRYLHGTPPAKALTVLASDGSPRTVLVSESTPEGYDAETQKLVLQRDGSWSAVDKPQAQIDAESAAKAKLEARGVKIAAAKNVKAKLEAGTALSTAELQAVVRILALDWIEANVPPDSEEEGEAQAQASK